MANKLLFSISGRKKLWYNAVAFLIAMGILNNITDTMRDGNGDIRYLPSIGGTLMNMGRSFGNAYVSAANEHMSQSFNKDFSTGGSGTTTYQAPAQEKTLQDIRDEAISVLREFFGEQRWAQMSYDDKTKYINRYAENKYGNPNPQPLSTALAEPVADNATMYGPDASAMGSSSSTTTTAPTGGTSTGGAFGTSTGVGGATGAGGIENVPAYQLRNGFFAPPGEENTAEFDQLQQSYDALINTYTEIENREKEAIETINKRKQKLLKDMESMTNTEFDGLREAYNEILKVNEDTKLEMMENADRKKSLINAMLGRDKSALAAERLADLRARGIDTSNPGALLSIAQKINLDYTNATADVEAQYLEEANQIIREFADNQMSLQKDMAGFEQQRQQMLQQIEDLRATADIAEIEDKLSAEDARDAATIEQGQFLQNLDRAQYNKLMTTWPYMSETEKLTTISSMLAGFGVTASNEVMSKVAQAVDSSGSFAQALQKIAGTVPMSQQAKAAIENLARRDGEFDYQADRPEPLMTSTQKAEEEAARLAAEEEKATRIEKNQQQQQQQIDQSELFQIQQTGEGADAVYSVDTGNGKVFKSKDKAKVESIRNALVKRFDNVGANYSEGKTNLTGGNSVLTDKAGTAGEKYFTQQGGAISSATSVGRKTFSEQKNVAQENEVQAIVSRNKAEEERQKVMQENEGLRDQLSKMRESGDFSGLQGAGGGRTQEELAEEDEKLKKAIGGTDQQVFRDKDGDFAGATFTFPGETALEKARREQKERERARRKARLSGGNTLSNIYK